MANHCQNTIIISNFENTKDYEKLIKQINKLTETEDSLLLLAKTKKEIDKLWKKGLIPFANELGTKWIAQHDIQDSTDYIEIDADSAWAPPTGWALIISKKYNCSITIKYDEPGMAFLGVYIATKGEIIKDELIEY